MICKNCKLAIKLIGENYYAVRFNHGRGHGCYNSDSGKHEPAGPVVVVPQDYCPNCLSASREARLQPIATMQRHNPPRTPCTDSWHEQAAPADSTPPKGNRTASGIEAFKQQQYLKPESGSTRPESDYELDDRNAGSKRTHKVVFDGMSEPVENTRTEPLSGNYQLLQDSTDDAARMEAARLDRYMRYAAAPRTQGSEPEHAHPPIPAYLTNPTVFADANLGTAMIATWNKEQWVFRIVNGGWVSYRRTDPWFIDTSCPGCISDNAPHFAKCTTPKKPVNTDTSSGDFQKAVAAQPQPAPRPNLELISAAICKEVYGPYMATVDAGHREIAVKSIVKILEPFFTAIPAQKRGEIIE